MGTNYFIESNRMVVYLTLGHFGVLLGTLFLVEKELLVDLGQLLFQVPGFLLVDQMLTF